MHTMNEELRAELARLGHDPEKALWGRIVGEGPGEIRIETPAGRRHYFDSPFVAVRAADQAAVVRCG